MVTWLSETAACIPCVDTAYSRHLLGSVGRGATSVSPQLPVLPRHVLICVVLVALIFVVACIGPAAAACRPCGPRTTR
jgi:hypothetical protein